MLGFPWNYRDSVYSCSHSPCVCLLVPIAWGYGPTLFSSVQLMCVVVDSVDEIR